VEQVYLPFRYRQPVRTLVQVPAQNFDGPTHFPPTHR
jgi:hypothetical protein